MIQSPSLHSRFEILYKLTGISRNSFQRRWAYEVGHHSGIDWGNTRVPVPTPTRFLTSGVAPKVASDSYMVSCYITVQPESR